MFARRWSLCAATSFVVALAADAMAEEKPLVGSAEKKIRVGIIGLDTSHVTAFTGAVQKAPTESELASLAIVAAYPGGSPDVAASRDRVAGFTESLRKAGVEIVDTIPALLEKVDAVLLESVDGRPHLEQVRPVLAAGKPVFIDKPVAGSLADALEIFRLAEAAGVPCFSSSSLRFSPSIQGLRNDPKVGEPQGCIAFSPCALEEHHPDLFWYGIHGVESLYTIMGPGCVSVVRTHTPDTDVVTGVWRDGRVGTFRGLRGGKPGYGVVAFGSKGIGYTDRYGGYEPLLVEIARFFKSGKPPVSAAETIEIMAFMEAADESKRQGGAPVTLESVMQRAAGKK